MNKEEFDKHREKYGHNIWPKTKEEFDQKMEEILSGPMDYNTSADAMVKAFVLTSNYVAGRLGLTGFQHSAAEMEYLGVSRDLRVGGNLFDASDFLYPQYDGKFEEWRIKTLEELKDEANRLLNESPDAHPDVIKRWKEVEDGSLLQKLKGS